MTRRFVHDALNRLDRRSRSSRACPGKGRPGRSPRTATTSSATRRRRPNLAGLITRFEFDGLYRVKAKVLPEVMPAGFGPPGPLPSGTRYDKVGNRTSFTDANGHETSWAYDGLNRVTRTTNALGQITTIDLRRPRAERRTSTRSRGARRDARPRGRPSAYDALNRETSASCSLEGRGRRREPAYTTATAYDDRNAHRVTVTDPRGVVTLTPPRRSRPCRRADGRPGRARPRHRGRATTASATGSRSPTANGHTTRFRARRPRAPRRDDRRAEQEGASRLRRRGPQDQRDRPARGSSASSPTTTSAGRGARRWPRLRSPARPGASETQLPRPASGSGSRTTRGSRRRPSTSTASTG